MLNEIDKEIRKALKDLNIYARQITQWRLYSPISKMGYGLSNCRDEYGKELLRVYLKYKWDSDTNIIL